MASSSAPAKPIIGVLSIGDMGLGIAKLLLDHEYTVYTSSTGRSQHTVERIRAAKINDVPTDEELLAESDIILSIVPPRDALATAARVVAAAKEASKLRASKHPERATSIILVDLNAISPRTMSKIADLTNNSDTTMASPGPGLLKRLSRTLSSATKEPRPSLEAPVSSITFRLLDGAIIGGPPTKQTDGSWSAPSIPTSGPEAMLPSELMSTLNMKHISTKIGAASTLKACFASMSKGFTALASMAFTTAQTAGVLPELQSQMANLFPEMLKRAEGGLTGMPPKAYRWVDEMKQIGETFKDVGGLRMGNDTYGGIADMYRFIADETELGSEKIGKRKRGTTSEDVASAIREGVEKKNKKKAEGGEEKLDLAWRSSWS